MEKFRVGIFLILVVPCLTSNCSSQSLTIIEVSAGTTDRRQTPVIFDLPKSAEEVSDLALVNDETGQTLPIQRINANQVVFILTQLDSGTTHRYQLVEGRADSTTIAESKDAGSGPILIDGGNEILKYSTAVMQPPENYPNYYSRSGFIHPIRTRSGRTITDGFPVGHTHQHGVFMAWVLTTYKGDTIDFWNQQNELGNVAHEEIIEESQGPVYVGFKTRLKHLSRKHGEVLNETWNVILYHQEAHSIFDIESTQSLIGPDTLIINKFYYGGMAFRGAHQWNREDPGFTKRARFITSQGIEGPKANHTRPDWVALYGEVDSELAGVAIMGHSTNFRHPQPVRIHPEMPYFCFIPTVDKGFSIDPGQKYRSRYRFYVFDGEPKIEKIQRLYQDYVNPPDVKILVER